MVRLLERAGIIITIRFGVPEVDAIAQVVPELPPMIFVNQDAPMDRLRFTLAHELGHLVMHAFPHPELEEEANRFAAEFLMPVANIRTQFAQVSLPVLAMLKKVWRVSMAALLQNAPYARWALT